MTKNATNEVPETNSGPDYACGILRPKYQQSSVGPGALTRHWKKLENNVGNTGN